MVRIQRWGQALVLVLRAFVYGAAHDISVRSKVTIRVRVRLRYTDRDKFSDTSHQWEAWLGLVSGLGIGLA